MTLTQPTQVQVTADGLWRCFLCSGDFWPGALPPHNNVCTRWQCSKCGSRFALFPEPLKKQFGADPLCYACKGAQAPLPTHKRKLKPPRAKQEEEETEQGEEEADADGDSG